MKSVSITRRLVGTILLLELLSAMTLILAVTFHEYHVQLKAFDSTLVAGTESLMGAVQDAEDKDDNVLLDLRTVRIEKNAVFRVTEEHGRLLGSSGSNSDAAVRFAGNTGIQNETIGGLHYRFYAFRGLRIIDPGEPGGGTSHTITVVYGLPTDHVWHEVMEEVRFAAISTVVVLAITALLMVLTIRKRLLPIYELALNADKIHSGSWFFDTPLSAKETVELRPLAKALEAAIERVHRSFEQQRRFTSDAAHELKTDVAIVKSSLQLLAMRRRTEDEYAAGLELSLNDFTRLEETVQKLLTLARLEQEGRTEDQKASYCSLKEAAEEAVHQSDAFAQLKEIRMSIDSEIEGFVSIDRRDAVLLCSNLLMNALQHSAEHGSVQFSLMHEGPNTVLRVQDWGEGIAEEDRPYLFHPFYRGDVSRSRKSGGTGLGLAICKAICARAGGSIDIANHAEGGVLVTVSLPSFTTPQLSTFSASLKAQ